MWLQRWMLPEGGGGALAEANPEDMSCALLLFSSDASPTVLLLMAPDRLSHARGNPNDEANTNNEASKEFVCADKTANAKGHNDADTATRSTTMLTPTVLTNFNNADKTADVNAKDVNPLKINAQDYDAVGR